MYWKVDSIVQAHVFIMARNEEISRGIELLIFIPFSITLFIGFICK